MASSVVNIKVKTTENCFNNIFKLTQTNNISKVTQTNKRVSDCVARQITSHHAMSQLGANQKQGQWLFVVKSHLTIDLAGYICLLHSLLKHEQ